MVYSQTILKGKFIDLNAIIFNQEEKIIELIIQLKC